MTTASNKLPNLNALRFFAATIVVLFHVDKALANNGYKELEYHFFPFTYGDTAVILFFVLSGFLITYLLLKEKKQTETLDIKRFYLKRIFRIWPLYYLVVILSFAYFNNSPFFYDNSITNRINFTEYSPVYFLLLAMIAPNVVLLKSRTIGYASHTWSIGVEEQFYLLWPWIMRSKNYLNYVLLIIVIMFPLHRGIIQAFSDWLISMGTITTSSGLYRLLYYCNKFFTFWASFRIDAMAIGALGAYLVTRKPSFILKLVFSKTFQIIVYLCAVLLAVFKGIFSYQVYSLVFMLMIVNLACNKNSILSFENKYLDYLGNISYGIYMYHYFFLIPAIKLGFYFIPGEIKWQSEIFIHTVAFSATIVTSALSYRYFESNFLKLKNKLGK